MQILVTFLITVFVMVSCKDEEDYASCEDYCNRARGNSNIEHSVRIGDLRCYDMRGDAHELGKKQGVCYDGPFLKGIHKAAVDPDPEACQALIDQAKENCKKLPPDPSMMDQTVSGTTVFKDGKPFLIDAKPVKIKGEVCSCNQKK